MLMGAAYEEVAERMKHKNTMGMGSLKKKKKKKKSTGGVLTILLGA